MVNPDGLVASHGESVILNRLTAAVYNPDDDLDHAASTSTNLTIKAVCSLPSEKELRSFQGRQRMPTLRLTVLHDLDILSNRNGRPDRVSRGGYLYEVEEVRNDFHPFVGVPKKTVYLVPLPGR